VTSRLPYHDGLSADSPIPLYHQLEVAIRELVLAGELKPGAPLPTEIQLQEEYGVSRSTVRKAIDELERAGLIVKRHGVGTFVAEPGSNTFKCLSSFTAEALREGREPGTTILDFEVAPGKQPGTSRLRLGSDDEVVFVKRLRLLDGEPVYVSYAYIAGRLVPDLSPAAFNGGGIDQSLYHLIQSHYGVSLAEGEEVTTAVEADEEVARIFGLNPGSPVVKESCLLRNRAGIPVVYEEAVWGLPQVIRIRWQQATPPNQPQLIPPTRSIQR
jgi:GntR family transcriptional regulator, N-acetylglucosamine utilization regulator